MKKVIAAAGLGAALLGDSLATTAAASASPHSDFEVVFIQTLGDENVRYSSEDDAIWAGRQVCNWILTGYTPRNIATEMDGVTTLTRDQSFYFVSTSVIAFCPEKIPVLAADPAFN